MDHKIEQTVQVYLLWDNEAQQWAVDPITFDGYPLDTAPLERRARNEECVCERLDECEAARARADAADLPTGAALIEALTVARDHAREHLPRPPS